MRRDNQSDLIYRVDTKIDHRRPLETDRAMYHVQPEAIQTFV